MRCSVLLPVYNAETHLLEALDSLARQDEPGFEVVAVDDGSTDGSLAILEDHARLDSRVRVIGQPHQGLVAALNHGLKRCRGRYVARMDADDVSLPGRLKAQADYLDSNPAIGLVAGRAEYLGDPAANHGLALYVDWTNSLLRPDQINLNRFVESPLVHPTAMFRRKLIGKHGGYRQGGFPEDYELWLRWLEAGVRFAKLEETVLQWRERPERLTRVDPRYSVDAFYRCKAPFLARRLAVINPHHPAVVVWGAGRISRLRLKPLLTEGIEVRAFVDIDPNKTGRAIDGVPVIAPTELPPAGECFVLQWVGARGARELIAETLRERGFSQGRDYLLCA